MTFRIVDGREHFWQWDLNRKIEVLDPSIVEVHFCNRTDSCSLVVEVKDGIAEVPNVLLQSGYKMRVFGYDGEATLHEANFDVKARSKPADYVYTEVEIKNYDDLADRVTAIEQGGLSEDAVTEAVEGYLEKHPVDFTGLATEDYVDTAVANAKVDLTGYATEDYVDKAIEGIDIPTPEAVDLTGYAKEQWVREQGYLTEHQSLEDYATYVQLQMVSSRVPTKVSQLTNDKGYINKHQDISHLATIREVQAVEDKIPTKTSEMINDSGFLTEHQDLTHLAPITHTHPSYVTQDNLGAYATKSELGSYAPKTLLNSYATKAEMDEAIAEASLGADLDLTEYAKKTDIPDVSGFIKDIPAEYVTETELEAKKYATKGELDSTVTALSTSINTELTNYATKSSLNSYATDAEVANTLKNYALKQDIPNVSGFLTEIPAEYVTESELLGKKYVNETALANKHYVTETELASKNYVEESALTTSNELLIAYVDSSVSGLAKKTDIPDTSKFITSIPSEYVTDTELNAKAYATKTYVDEAIADIDVGDIDLSEYAKKTDIPDVSGFANKTDIPDVSGFITEVPAEYITETELNAKGYLTEHQDLSAYALKADVPSIAGLATEDYVDEAIKDVDVDLTGYATEDYVDEAIAEIKFSEEAIGCRVIYVTDENTIDDIEGILAAGNWPVWKGTYLGTEMFLPYVDHSGNVYNFGAHIIDRWYSKRNFSGNWESITVKYTSSNTNINYATTDYVDSAVANVKVDLTGYATEQFVEDAIANLEIPGGGSNVDLSEYAKKSDIPDVSDFISEIPEEYITETELSTYATKEYVEDAITRESGGSGVLGEATPLYRHDIQLKFSPNELLYSPQARVWFSITNSRPDAFTVEALWTWMKAGQEDSSDRPRVACSGYYVADSDTSKCAPLASIMAGSKSNGDYFFICYESSTNLTARVQNAPREIEDVVTKIGTAAVVEGGEADLTNYYTKTEVDGLIDGIEIPEATDLSNYYTKTEVDDLIPEPTDLGNYYTKDETYSKTEVEGLIANIDIPESSGGGSSKTAVYLDYSATTEPDWDKLTAICNCLGNNENPLEEYDIYIVSLDIPYAYGNGENGKVKVTSVGGTSQYVIFTAGIGDKYLQVLYFLDNRSAEWHGTYSPGSGGSSPSGSGWTYTTDVWESNLYNATEIYIKMKASDNQYYDLWLTSHVIFNGTTLGSKSWDRYLFNMTGGQDQKAPLWYYDGSYINLELPDGTSYSELEIAYKM